MSSIDVRGFTTKVFHSETFRLAAKWDGISLLQDSTEPELGHCVTRNSRQKIHPTVIPSKEWDMALHLRAFCGIKSSKSRTQGKHRGVVLLSLIQSWPTSLETEQATEQAGLAIEFKASRVRTFAPAVCSVGNVLPL